MYHLLSSPKDGNPVLGARFSPGEAAALRQYATHHNCTISDIIREGVRTVIQPSNTLAEQPPFPAMPMRPRTLPPGQAATRQALSNSLAEKTRLAGAEAAVLADRRSRPHQGSGDGAVFLPGSPWARR
jgi:hypothetical protein